MSAIVIVRIKPRDASKMPAYAAAAAPTLAAFGGELVHRGAYDSVLLGEAEPHALGVLRFPKVDAAKAWFNSPAYQAVAQLREEAAEMTFVLYELAG